MSRHWFVLGVTIIAAAAAASIQDPVPIPLPSYTHSAATGVNNRGLIVGYVYTYPQGHAFLWSARSSQAVDCRVSMIVR
jgi:probable HAF family extracellular repeat protein